MTVAAMVACWAVVRVGLKAVLMDVALVVPLVAWLVFPLADESGDCSVDLRVVVLVVQKVDPLELSKVARLAVW